MFKDLFDFTKERSPKQAFGFLLAHAGMLVTALLIISGLGLA